MVSIGMVVGALTLQLLDGPSFLMDNYGERGGTVILFLSSRCDTTAAVIDMINATYEKYRFRGVLFVGLCANDDETADELRAFCQRRGVRFPVYRDPAGAGAGRLGARFTPEAFLLDGQGVLVYRGGFHGRDAARDFDETLGHLVAGQPLPHQTFEASGTPIDAVGTAREVADPYGLIAFSSELIFEKIAWAPVHHCSTLVEAANGDLLCTWYGGSYESADDQVLFLARRARGERTWSEPQILVKGPPHHPPGNAVILRLGADRIGLIWGRMDASRPIRRGGGWGECQLMFRYSDDHGHTWSPDTELDGYFGCLPRNVPIVLEDGRLMVPLSGRVDGRSGCFFLVTSDNGETWERAGFIEGGSQPTVIQRSDGSLLALMRSKPYILQSESRDLGKTWSPAQPTALRCPGAGIAMARLRNGHLVLVFDDSSTARTPLAVALSTDEGATWKAPLNLESNPGEYSYPCVIQTADGMIHVTHTFRRYAIKHVELNEDWLIHFDRPN